MVVPYCEVSRHNHTQNNLKLVLKIVFMGVFALFVERVGIALPKDLAYKKISLTTCSETILRVTLRYDISQAKSFDIS